MSIRYAKSAHWTLFLEDDRLVASAGADELYLLDELSATQARALESAWRTDQLDGEAHGPRLRQLERLGAVYRLPQAPRARLRFSLRGSPPGSSIDTQVLDSLLPAYENLTRTDGDADLIVWLRASGTLLSALDDYAQLRTPHLFVDLAYHHTISLGPLVWPGETACLGCVSGRIRHTWGDPEPPPEPLASTRAPLAWALVLEQLRQFQTLGSCPQLVERTISLQVETLVSKTERVHRLPWCPFCFPSEEPYGTGSFALPWIP